ncbi:hypothetical protein ACFX1T_008730 [Malus domestica]
MEESIRSLCKGVASFCNHFHSSCDALKTSIDRRPIPLDTASSNFLNPSTAASPPPAPNSTSLKRSELEIDEDDFERTPVVQEEGFYAPVIDEEEDLLDESLSLKKLGLSDASLATLASQGEVEDKPKLAEVPLPLVKVSQDDYESLPSYMKSLAPWEV